MISTLLLFRGFIYLEHVFLFVFSFHERNAASDKYSHEALETGFLDSLSAEVELSIGGFCKRVKEKKKHLFVLFEILTRPPALSPL